MEEWALKYYEELGACYGLDKLKQFDTWEDAWNAWDRGDDLLWMAARSGIDRKRIVLAACECAELSLKYLPPDEDRPRKAIEAAKSWANGEDISLSQVRDAAAHAADANTAAYNSTIKICADIVRKYITYGMMYAVYQAGHCETEV